MAEPVHPAVELVLDALGDSHLTLRTTMERDDGAVAVVVENDRVRRVVIVQHREGRWSVPQVVGGSARRVGTRPARTTRRQPFFDHSVTQSGWPQDDGTRPAVAWQALSGFAAEDAEAVLVETAHDAHESLVADDGFFVTLARAAWSESPTVHVRLRGGDLVHVPV